MHSLFIENFIQHTFSSKKAIYRNSCRTLLLHGGIKLEKLQDVICRSSLYCTLNKTKLLQLVKENKIKNKTEKSGSKIKLHTMNMNIWINLYPTKLFFFFFLTLQDFHSLNIQFHCCLYKANYALGSIPSALKKKGVSVLVIGAGFIFYAFHPSYASAASLPMQITVNVERTGPSLREAPTLWYSETQQSPRQTGGDGGIWTGSVRMEAGKERDEGNKNGRGERGKKKKSKTKQKKSLRPRREQPKGDMQIILQPKFTFWKNVNPLIISANVQDEVQTIYFFFFFHLFKTDAVDLYCYFLFVLFIIQDLQKKD